MNYIYINKSNGRKFVLDPCITCGDKVCVIDMINCEHKFLSPKTLKRNYSKTVTEDYVVEVVAFTGMKLGMFMVSHTCTNEMVVFTKSNKCLVFDADLGIQTNAKNPKFANKMIDTHNYTEHSLNWVLN